MSYSFLFFRGEGDAVNCRIVQGSGFAGRRGAEARDPAASLSASRAAWWGSGDGAGGGMWKEPERRGSCARPEGFVRLCAGYEEPLVVLEERTVAAKVLRDGGGVLHAISRKIIIKRRMAGPMKILSSSYRVLVSSFGLRASKKPSRIAPLPCRPRRDLDEPDPRAASAWRRPGSPSGSGRGHRFGGMVPAARQGSLQPQEVTGAVRRDLGAGSSPEGTEREQLQVAEESAGRPRRLPQRIRPRGESRRPCDPGVRRRCSTGPGRGGGAGPGREAEPGSTLQLDWPGALTPPRRPTLREMLEGGRVGFFFLPLSCWLWVRGLWLGLIAYLFWFWILTQRPDSLWLPILNPPRSISLSTPPHLSQRTGVTYRLTQTKSRPALLPTSIMNRSGTRVRDKLC